MNICVNASTDSLVDLLGATRAAIVERLRDAPCGVAALAEALGLSEVAVRRHLGVLAEDDLVAGQTARRDGPGRPATHYRLTERARRLFPDRTGEFANELLTFLREREGADAVEQFLRWRQERVRARYAAVLAEAGEDRAARVERLAELLTEDGFTSHVASSQDDGGSTLTLTQGHCAIREVAEAHPEVCRTEAQMFEDLLGVGVSRERTLARGASHCVCEIPTDQPARHPVDARPRSDRDE